MPATRKTGVRVLALALACAPNAALFLLMWFSRGPDTEEQPVFAMLWLTERQPPQPLPAPPPVPNEPRAAASVQLPLPVVPPALDVPEESTAISVPPIDWYAEGLRSARKEFPDNAREKPEASLDSKPRAMTLPDKSNEPHKFGDVEHYEGGEIITWINETCFISSSPAEGGFGGRSDYSQAPRLKMPKCKVRSMAERNSEKYAAEIEKTLQEKYQRPKVPEPVPEPVVERD